MKPSASNEQKNRRRFFRIVDALGVSYRVISDKEAQLKVRSDQDSESGFVDAFSLMSNYNKEIQESLDDLNDRDPAAASAIETLNRKVDAMLMMLELDSLITQKVDHRIEQASISASGLAFPVEEKLEPHTRLALDLLLKPSSQHVEAIGRVVACDSLREKGQYYLRVEFVEMNDQDKERLIQHIVQRQGALLRALKSEMDNL